MSAIRIIQKGGSGREKAEKAQEAQEVSARDRACALLIRQALTIAIRAIEDRWLPDIAAKR